MSESRKSAVVLRGLRTLFSSRLAGSRARLSQDALPCPRPRLAPRDTPFLSGRCNVCGSATRFFYTDPALYRESLICAHCLTTSRYRSIARGILDALRRLAGVEAPSLAELPRRVPGRRLAVYDTQLPFDNGGSAYPIPHILGEKAWLDLRVSTFRPDAPLGRRIGPRATNQNLERLRFRDASFDIVVTSDVMEHVRLAQAAHREIRRVLRPGGIYLFTVPHFRDRQTLTRVQVVDPEDPSQDVALTEPEYHQDANSPEGRALSYRSFGTDLDDELRGLGFDVAYTMEDFPDKGILNTELFSCALRLPSP
jgi:SAM-dependent methyltransferase